ncbi:hypothetical protein FACS189472_07260 [Alphaproteobacteria bacterium]|nr:hypothetical protein FACS189472_07260 [Alphaproteobacteria bacterium]
MQLQKWIELLVSDKTYVDPENVLLWTTKSLRNIHDAILLKYQVYISLRSIAAQLKKMWYSLQGESEKIAGWKESSR